MLGKNPLTHCCITQYAGEPEDDRHEADEAQLAVGEREELAEASRQSRGATSGSRPSTTSTSANAASSESGTRFP